MTMEDTSYMPHGLINNNILLDFWAHEIPIQITGHGILLISFMGVVPYSMTPHSAPSSVNIPQPLIQK